MAIDFYELGKQTGAKTPKDQQSNFGAFMGGITNTVDQMIAASQIKTAALQAAMPQGIAIEKVPEELRAQATEFLTTNKKAYTDASKVLASGINPQSQRYRDAVETINGVNTKFENLSTSLEGVALKRKAALDDPNGYSPSTSKEDRLTWGNLSNGDLYSNMTFNDDGTVNYTNSQGESKSFADFNVSPQSFEGQNTFLALNDKFTNAKYSGKSNQWSMHSGEAETTVNALFQKLKPAGQKDMMMGDIDYLEKTTGFQSGTDEYENAINGILENPNDAIAGYKQHMLQTLENNYNSQKGPKGGGGDNVSESNPYGIPKDGLKLGAPMANGYRMKVRKDVVEGYINNIKAGRKFEFKNNKYTFVDGQWVENEGGMFRPGEEAPEKIIGSTQELTDNVFENGGKYFDGLVTEVEIDPNTGKVSEQKIEQVPGTQSSFSPNINMSFMDKDDNDIAIGLQSLMPSAFGSNNPNGYKFKNLRSIIMDDFTAEAVGLYDDDDNIVRYPEGHAREGEKVIIYTGGNKERRMKAIADLDDILNTKQFKIKGFASGGQTNKADDLINKYSN